jgi:UDP:flavonoid glycosyltransferase YjiC (YdhE family)
VAEFRTLAALCRANGIPRRVLALPPDLKVALYSRVMQQGTAKDVVAVGFPRYGGPTASLSDALLRFLQPRDRPTVVVTLGSGVVDLTGSLEIYQTMIAAGHALDLRLVLLVSEDLHNRLRDTPIDARVFVTGHTDLAELLRHVDLIVHHGGMGTIGQALRAGVPMLIAPFVADQPLNAHSLCRLGVARTLTVGEFTPERAAAELSNLMRDGSYRDKATEMADVLREEDGAVGACDLIERYVHDRTAAGGTSRHGKETVGAA